MRPGTDAIHPHALGSQFNRQATGQRVDRALRAGVVDIKVGRAEPRRGRRNEHDRAALPAAALHHPPRRLARGEVGAQSIDLEDVAHALEAHVGELRRRRGDAGVDHDVGDRAERVLRADEHADDVVFTRDVAAQRDGAAADFRNRLDDFLRGAGVQVVIDADRPAARGGGDRRRAADAARSAGDENRSFGASRPRRRFWSVYFARARGRCKGLIGAIPIALLGSALRIRRANKYVVCALP